MSDSGWQKFSSFITQHEIGMSFSRKQFLAWANENQLARGSVDGYRNQLVRTGYLKIYKRGTYELVNKIPLGTTLTEIQMLLSGDRLQYLEKIVTRKEKTKRDEERRKLFEIRKATNERILAEAIARPCLDCRGSFPAVAMCFSYRQTPRWHRTLSKLILRDSKELIDEVSKCDVICMNCHLIRNSIGGILSWEK